MKKLLRAAVAGTSLLSFLAWYPGIQLVIYDAAYQMHMAPSLVKAAPFVVGVAAFIIWLRVFVIR